MKLIRDMQTHEVVASWEPPDRDSESYSEPKPGEGQEVVELDVTLEEFRRECARSAGAKEDGEPQYGRMFAEDEGVAFGNADSSKNERAGKRVGHKRIKAYLPDTKTHAERLADEFKAKPNHNITYAVLSEWERRMNG